MDADSLITILSILFLILLSAFFAGSETALTTTSRGFVHRRVLEGERRAILVSRLIDDKERLIGSMLLGNNLANILASALATSLSIQFFGEKGVVYATFIMTALVLVFAEVLPKTYAISNPDRMALTVAPLVMLVVKLLSPFVQAVRQIVRATLHVFGIDISEAQNVLSPSEEIRGYVDLHASEGGIVKAHRDMLGSIFELDEIPVGDVMIHRKNIEMIDASLSPAKIVEKVVESSHTRIPLWRDTQDNIVGVLHSKDVLRAVRKSGGDFNIPDIDKIAISPWFVPETTTLQEQLNAFLERRAHFALVVDEYGTLMGLITLEDILEEIVGEISDERDILGDGIQVNKDGSIVVIGAMPIRDLNRRFDWPLSDEEATTIAGLVINRAENIPSPGETFIIDGFTFEVLRRHRNQITALRITPPADGAEI
jgi:Mg2+/Co2+ transporter CorB